MTRKSASIKLALIASIFYGFFFQAEDGIRDGHVTGVQTCALPIYIGGQFQQTQVVILRAKAGIAAQEFAVVKIGRASCRERGETSVEGIPIRKKGNKSVADVKVQ